MHGHYKLRYSDLLEGRCVQLKIHFLHTTAAVRRLQMCAHIIGLKIINENQGLIADENCRIFLLVLSVKTIQNIKD